MRNLMQAFLPPIFLAISVRAYGWTVDSMPDPRTEPLECGRWVEGWVCSPDGLVQEEYLSIIQGYIASIYAGEYPYSEMFCPERGEDVPVEVMAVIISEVEGTGDVATKVADFTKGIHGRFGVGDAVCGSGAMIVLSVNDRQVYISTGALVGAQLDQRQIDVIISAMRPQLRRKRYGRAMEHAVVQAGLVLSTAYNFPDYGDYDHSEDGDEGDDTSDESPWLDIMAMLFPGLLWLPFMLWVRKSLLSRPQQQGVGRAVGVNQNFVDVGQKLERIRRDLQASKAGQYVSSSCPICLEDFGPGTTAAGAGGEAASSGTAGDGGATPRSAQHAQHGPHCTDLQEPLLSPQHCASDITATAAEPIEEVASAQINFKADAAAAARGSGACCSVLGAPPPHPERPAAADGSGHQRPDAALKEAARAVDGEVVAAEGGSAAAARTAAAIEAQASDVREAVMLRCGHVFCEACIAEWLRCHAECPICRKPTRGDPAAEEGANEGGAQAPQRQGGPSGTLPATAWPVSAAGPGWPCRGDGGRTFRRPQSGFDLYGPELVFRLARMRLYHPGAVSPLLVARTIDEAYGRGTPDGHYGCHRPPSGGHDRRPCSACPRSWEDRHPQPRRQRSAGARAPAEGRRQLRGVWQAAMFLRQVSSAAQRSTQAAGSRPKSLQLGGGAASGGGGGGW